MISKRKKRKEMELRQKEDFTDEEDDDKEEVYSEFETTTDSEFDEEQLDPNPDKDYGFFMKRYKYLKRANFFFRTVVVLELPRADYTHVIIKSVENHFFIAGILRK